MSRFPQHGQTGGGGVKRPTGSPPGSQPPQRATANPQFGVGPNADSLSNRWPSYLEGGYFDADGNLKVEYVSRCLPGDEHLSDGQQHGVEPLIRAMAQSDPALTTGQIRRFFGHCRALESRIKTKTATWDQLRAEFQKLDVAAADAYGKKPKAKIPELFYLFIRRNVAAVHSEKDFLKGFLPHFEALVGFGSIHIQKDRN